MAKKSFLQTFKKESPQLIVKETPCYKSELTGEVSFNHIPCLPYKVPRPWDYTAPQWTVIESELVLIEAKFEMTIPINFTIFIDGETLILNPDHKMLEKTPMARNTSVSVNFKEEYFREITKVEMELTFLDKNKKKFVNPLLSNRKGSVGEFEIINSRIFHGGSQDGVPKNKYGSLIILSNVLKFVSVKLIVVFKPKMKYLMRQLRGKLFKPPTGLADFKIICTNKESQKCYFHFHQEYLRTISEPLQIMLENNREVQKNVSSNIGKFYFLF